MANGFSGTMDWILPNVAERFVAAGLGVLMFDYRHLGESGGVPRQIVDVSVQREDLRQAVAFARSRAELDPAHIALWGTSLGGSHVVEHAARDPAIAAVVLETPALDAYGGADIAEKIERMNVSRTQLAIATARLAGAAIYDAIRGKLGLSPHYIAVYGEPGRAVFCDPDLAERFATVTTGSTSWQNRVAARFLLQAPRYREGTFEAIAAPIHVSLATDDVEVSRRYVKQKASRARHVEVHEYEAGHFDMYHGDVFEQVVADQTRFLEAYLLPPVAAAR